MSNLHRGAGAVKILIRLGEVNIIDINLDVPGIRPNKILLLFMGHLCFNNNIFFEPISKNGGLNQKMTEIMKNQSFVSQESIILKGEF